MHAFHRYLCRRLGEQLLERRVVVFYDPRREFEAFVTVHPPSELGRPHGLPAEERGLSFPFPFPDSTFDHERLDVYKAASV